MSRSMHEHATSAPHLGAAVADLTQQPLAIGSDPAGLPAVCWRRAEFTLLPEVPVLPVSQVRKLVSWGELRSIPSRKMRRDTITTSKAERQLAYESEWDGEVSFFLEQPFGIQYRLGGRRATYTPDLYRLRAGCHEVIEAKNLVGAAEPDWTIREPAIREAFAELGFQFVVWVLEEMAPEPRARNIWRQIRDRQSAIPKCADLVCGHLTAAGPTPLWNLMFDLGVGFEAVRRLVAHGLVDADVDQPFDYDIVLSSSGNPLRVGGRS